MCVADLELKIAEITDIAEDEETLDPGPQSAAAQAPGVAWG